MTPKQKGRTKINRITMQGFKSFNKKVSVPFMEGFNIVCGPNGVGKSNIIDAVCFVLGRTSAKSMRAGRLHELIFHGGKNKGAAKQAVVTMYLDNTEKAFDYDDDEISVTRKVNKKGVSVYKMNGRTTTRQRILETLASARIYPDGHNIVLQGDIMHIIEMNPIQRRGIIDEISGIADYNDKKEKAEKDMETVNQKLREAEILIRERYERFKRLEEERNAAIKYKNLQSKALLLKASLANKRVETSEQTMEELDQKIATKSKEIEELDEKIEELDVKIHESEQAMDDIQQKVIDISKKMGEEKKISELRSNILVAKNKIDSHDREIDNLDRMIEQLEAFESRTRELSGALPRSVKTILELGIKGVHGAVRDLIRVPDEYSIAIEIAGGGSLNDIVVENEDVAKYCVDFLKREKIGRATFLPLNKIRPRLFKNDSMLNKDGVIGVASKLLKYDTKYISAMEYVFGNTLIIKDFGTAKKLGIGRQRMVTLEGDLIEHSGAVTGGHFFKKHPKALAKSSESEIETYRSRKKNLMRELDILGNELKEMEKELRKYGGSEKMKESVDLEKMRVNSRDDLEKLRGKKERYYQKKLKVQNDINRFEVEKSSIEGNLKNAKIEVSQFGEMEYIDDDVKSLEKFYRKTMDELNALGPINMKSIEEYDFFKNKFDEYKQKYEKIMEEKKAVLDMIETIESKRMEVFYECLKKVGMHFSNIFKKMTRGNASLELEEPTDIESGLVIQATPQGKKLLNIDSMSGGEKTLTALAFLFAIQHYKPAPFYVLDEVDAALDKENSKKIADLIKDMSDSEQFIMITHNDQTIKYGDRVYGMTMDRGESKILGIELPQDN